MCVTCAPLFFRNVPRHVPPNWCLSSGGISLLLYWMSMFYSANTEMYWFHFFSFVLCASCTGLFMPGMLRLVLPALQISVLFLCVQSCSFMSKFNLNVSALSCNLAWGAPFSPISHVFFGGWYICPRLGIFSSQWPESGLFITICKTLLIATCSTENQARQDNFPLRW